MSTHPPKRGVHSDYGGHIGFSDRVKHHHGHEPIWRTPDSWLYATSLQDCNFFFTRSRQGNKSQGRSTPTLEFLTALLCFISTYFVSRLMNNAIKLLQGQRRSITDSLPFLLGSVGGGQVGC